MNNSELIRALYAKGRTTRQIAEAVYGITSETPHKEADRKMAHIRVVARQRNGGYSPAEAKYVMRKWGGKDAREGYRNRSRARYADPVKYAKHLESCARYLARKREEAA